MWCGWKYVSWPVAHWQRFGPFVLNNLMVDLREFVFLQERNDACNIPYVIL